jgi:hypothetical protein
VYDDVAAAALHEVRNEARTELDSSIGINRTLILSTERQHIFIRSVPFCSILVHFSPQVKVFLKKSSFLQHVVIRQLPGSGPALLCATGTKSAVLTPRI